MPEPNLLVVRLQSVHCHVVSSRLPTIAVLIAFTVDLPSWRKQHVLQDWISKGRLPFSLTAGEEKKWQATNQIQNPLSASYKFDDVLALSRVVEGSVLPPWSWSVTARDELGMAMAKPSKCR